MKLLIVDDAKLIHFMVKKIINEAGIEGIEFADAYNGVEAVDVAQSFEPDLILLDVVMPERDGIETLKSLTLEGISSHIVMVSSMGTEAKVNEALQLGATAFIQKPFDEEELVRYINKVLEAS